MIQDELKYIYRAVLKGKLEIKSFYDGDFLNIMDTTFPDCKMWVRFHLYDKVSEVIIPYPIILPIKEIIGLGTLNPRCLK